MTDPNDLYDLLKFTVEARAKRKNDEVRDGLATVASYLTDAILAEADRKVGTIEIELTEDNAPVTEDDWAAVRAAVHEAVQYTMLVATAEPTPEDDDNHDRPLTEAECHCTAEAPRGFVP